MEKLMRGSKTEEVCSSRYTVHARVTHARTHTNIRFAFFFVAQLAARSTSCCSLQSPSRSSLISFARSAAINNAVVAVALFFTPDFPCLAFRSLLNFLFLSAPAEDTRRRRRRRGKPPPSENEGPSRDLAAKGHTWARGGVRWLY